MISGKKGSMTIFLALTMMLFLSFCLVLVEGTRIWFLRTKAAQAMELAEFSILSEYQYELFTNYGIFFLDLDYEQGEERTEILEQRAGKYFRENAEEITVSGQQAEKFRRATDGGGAAFFRQVVEQEKVESGLGVVDAILPELDSIQEETLDLGKILSDSEAAAGGMLGEAVDEEGEPLYQISLPKISFPSIESLTEAVFGSETGLSEKSINPEERILHRTLLSGSGIETEDSFTEMQLFHGYLFRHFGYYGSKNPEILRQMLDYQLEYIISGEPSDRDNIENIMWRIFLCRAVGNYLFYHQDAEKSAKAEAEAVALVGITGNAALIRLVKEILLIAEAIENGISETKAVFAGEKVPVYQKGIFSGIQMGYSEYLYLFLCATDRTEKIYRCMDLVELEVQNASGYKKFRLDHCVDCFWLECTYRFDSLFRTIPLLEERIYENTISRKVFYQI